MYHYANLNSIDDVIWEDELLTWTLPGAEQELENEDEFGLVAGIEVEIDDTFSFNIEGRFISETSITVGGSFKF